MPERAPSRHESLNAPAEPPTATPAHRAAAVSMDTLVSIEVLSAEPEERVRAAMQRALDWFRVVERACSRFDPQSELRRLLASVGTPVPARP